MSEGEAGVAGGAGAGVGLCDAVLLAPLTEDTFLHNLHVRYKRDIIYTYVGNALVCVNPCRPLPLYSAELVRTYLARPPYQLPPHLYAITATAYRWVRDRNESQCIVITGESGSGKTEAARVCLQGCVVAGGGGGRPGDAGAAGGGGGRAGDVLAAAGTLLEAFGNAATALNHNASRFGKLLEVEFDFKGEPVGGHITHYLLEKDRARGVWRGERNFHVFYQLLAGADVPLLKRLKLQRSWEHYRILRGEARRGVVVGGAGVGEGESSRPPPEALDADHFVFTKGAMAALGMSAGACGGVLRVLAFLLKLGNVAFEPAHNIDGSLTARIQSEYELREACSLVGIDPVALCEALGVHEMSSLDSSDAASTCDSASSDADALEGEEEGEAGWAAAARDRIISAVYVRMFTWLVATVNDAVKPAEVGRRCSLGILDVYGLESLAYNGLDRLLINYAAERVQAAVLSASLRAPPQRAHAQGVAWRHAPVCAPSAADALDQGPDSLLSIMREAALAPGGDAVLLARLQRRRNAHVAPTPPHHFTVSHFGGPVRYDAHGMLRDNRDVLCARARSVLAAAREPTLALWFSMCGESPRRALPLWCRQRALLAALLRHMEHTRLVRCLRAHAAHTPRAFDAARVRHQLRTQGIVEMALVCRAGWSECMCARALVARYGVLGRGGAGGGASGAGGGADDPVRRARRLLRSLPIPSAEFAYGKTRVFIRSPRTVWELEALRASRTDALVRAAQRAWRAHRKRVRDHAQRVIARAYRRYRARLAPPPRVPSPLAAAVRSRPAAARRVWRWWTLRTRRRYLTQLWQRLPHAHLSPACAAWPPCPWPRLLSRTDIFLRRLHHAWRCRLYRAQQDQLTRNRMREKVTASILFKDRKASYACSVAHPFVGDYVRLRASAAWRRTAQHDQYVVFADIVLKVARSHGRVSRCLCVVSTAALLLLEPRSLRVRRRLPAAAVARLSLSPHHDDLLVLHVRCGSTSGGGRGAGSGDSSGEESQCSLQQQHAGCLLSGEGARRRRGDVVLRTRHVLELATKLFLVVQHARAAPPLVHVAPQFEANFGGGQIVTFSFHSGGAGEGGPRLLRRGSRMDVFL